MSIRANSTGVVLYLIGIITAVLLFFSSSHAQMRIIGVVFSENVPAYSRINSRFKDILKEKGYSKRVRFIEQHPNPDPLAWSNAIRKLIVYDAEMIIVYGSGALEQAIFETDSIPIVFVNVYSPDRLKINKRNVTGVGYKIPMTSLIRYLKEMKETKRLGILFSEIEPDSVLQMEDIVKACEKFSVGYVKMPVQKSGQVEERLKLFMYDALFFTNSAVIGKTYPECSQIPRSLNAPIISTMDGYDDSVVFSLSPDSDAQAKGLADIVISLINGRKTNIKIVRNNRLIFNLRLAREMQLQLPIELISGADRVIR